MIRLLFTIIAGVLLVFVPAIGMFGITQLMGGGIQPTIGEVIQNQFFQARAHVVGREQIL